MSKKINMFISHYGGDEKYIEKLVKRANYKNKDTIEKMNEIINFANTYMDKRLR